MKTYHIVSVISSIVVMTTEDYFIDFIKSLKRRDPGCYSEHYVNDSDNINFSCVDFYKSDGTLVAMIRESYHD